MLRVRRYFALLLFSSILCFLILAIFDSNLYGFIPLKESKNALQRYTRRISHLIRASDMLGSERDEFIRESDIKLNNVQELLRKLMSYNSSRIIFDEKLQIENYKIQTDSRRCTQQENVVFLKTHKTGSSTLTNIFNRFADLRELRVALPTVGYNRFRWPLPFHWTYVDMFLLDDNYANILCNHARYVKESMDAIMELDAKYVTILRDPIRQFESMFDYMEFSKLLGIQNATSPMRTFLTDPFQHIRNMTIQHRAFPESMHLIRNGQFFDLGLNPRSYDNKTLVLRAIEKIDREFSLVLIMEYFDESLVLLKRELCWDFEDIVYAKFNQRHRTKKEHVDNSLKNMIERWNGADVLLYRHFNQTFWKKIKSHGDAFYKDLKEFRVKNRQVQKDCISPVMAKEKAFRLTKEVTKPQLNPKVTNFDRYFCSKLLTDEVAYLKYFRFKYNPYFGYQKRLRQERNLPERTAMPHVSGSPQFISTSFLGQLTPQQPTFVNTPRQPSFVNRYQHTFYNTPRGTLENRQHQQQSTFLNNQQPTFVNTPRQPMAVNQKQTLLNRQIPTFNTAPLQHQTQEDHKIFRPQNMRSETRDLLSKPQFIDINHRNPV